MSGVTVHTLQIGNLYGMNGNVVMYIGQTRQGSHCFYVVCSMPRLAKKKDVYLHEDILIKYVRMAALEILTQPADSNAFMYHTRPSMATQRHWGSIKTEEEVKVWLAQSKLIGKRIPDLI
jgi:hypothetical protein